MALAERATDGPWTASQSRIETVIVDVYERREGVTVATTHRGYGTRPERHQGDEDAKFVAAARTLVPQLCAELKAAREEVERLKGEIERLNGRGQWLTDQLAAEKARQP